MKTDVEELTPTRVKLTVEVPFDELKPNLDKAYKEISQQVRIKGFRPGKVPAPLIDKYVGRGAVLQEAVNDALPELYGRAVEETEIFVLGQPDVEVTELDDGKQFAFTAEVDIRPKFEVPDYDGLEVVVDDAEVTDEQVEETIGNLRERFASLTAAERAVEEGDFATIDLVAKIDGEEIEDASTSGFSYEVGSESAIDGLDEALVGLSAGEDKTFTAALAGGERAGEEAEITATVQSVKVKNLPELDDEFAQLASEFDTIDELREDVRTRLARQVRLQQLSDARDKALEALLEKVDIPLPDKVVDEEIGRRNQQLEQQLQMAGMTKEDYLKDEEKSEEEFDTEVADAARLAVKGGFVLDQLAVQEELGVENEELSEYVVTQAMQMGVQPQQLAEYLTQNNQLPAIVSEVLRSKALNLVVEHVTVKDESGNEIDVEAVQRELNGGDGETVEAEATDTAEADETEATGTAEAETAEAADTEAADTEAADTEAADTEAAETEAADTEASDAAAEPAEPEAAEETPAPAAEAAAEEAPAAEAQGGEKKDA
ncbi:trigger factor [Actinomadura rubrisoli]|uniref:Trigger factor n=1 Tax=Actinomadura rubrisoli TaxID=2530368 RepID=A0A4R5BLU7_9ACTN|nr:trigger factor [Actinomadura rubrisoli]TDD86070.1 trigger factor [Actinomadura rubrisoli]